MMSFPPLHSTFTHFVSTVFIILRNFVKIKHNLTENSEIFRKFVRLERMFDTIQYNFEYLFDK